MGSDSAKKIGPIVDSLLDSFWERRIDTLATLDLKTALKRKNPYLFRATGHMTAERIIVSLLEAYMSSSDEGIFGDAFFEPLAREISGGMTSDADGVDIIIQDDSGRKAIAVKSGPSVYNAQSRREQRRNFESLRKRYVKEKKFFDAIVGYGYGQKVQKKDSDSPFRELAGQAFWEEISGDPEFYIVLSRVIGDKASEYQDEYEQAWDSALKKLTVEFANAFCACDDSIDWDKLVKFNSGKPLTKIRVAPEHIEMRPGGVVNIVVKAHYRDGSVIDITSDLNTSYSSPSSEIVVLGGGLIGADDKIRPGRKGKMIISYEGKKTTTSIRISD